MKGSKLTIEWSGRKPVQTYPAHWNGCYLFGGGHEVEDCFDMLFELLVDPKWSVERARSGNVALTLLNGRKEQVRAVDVIMR